MSHLTLTQSIGLDTRLYQPHSQGISSSLPLERRIETLGTRLYLTLPSISFRGAFPIFFFFLQLTRPVMSWKWYIHTDFLALIRCFFQCLVQCRKDVCKRLGLSVEDVELSMGMSNDFDKAVSAHKYKS